MKKILESLEDKDIEKEEKFKRRRRKEKRKIIREKCRRKMD